MNTIDINLLQAGLQEQVRSTLTTYDVAYVTRENGKYTYTAGLCLDTRVKASDFKTFEIKADDIYTSEERAEYRKENAKYNWEFMNN